MKAKEKGSETLQLKEAASSVTNLEDDIWLTREQMALRLRVSIRTIDYWTEDRTLPVYKKGRVVRYDPMECVKALQAFRRKSRFEEAPTN